MPMKILLKTGKNFTCTEYWVHDEHESDMYDFLKNHSNKSLKIGDAWVPKNGCLDWFSITLTEKDIETIKNTAWFHNQEWDIPDLSNQFFEGMELEVICVEYVPPKDGE